MTFDRVLSRLARSTHCHLVAALAVALVAVIGLHNAEGGFVPPAADALGYAGIALTVAEQGVFTNSGLAREPGVPQPPGMFFAPLYPGAVGLLAVVDDTLRDTIACHYRQRGPEVMETCGLDLGSIEVLQPPLLALAAFLVWPIAWVLSGRRTVAWVALGFTLCSAEYANYAGNLLTEAFVLPLFAAFSLALALAVKRSHPGYWLLVGGVLGLLALTRPSFAYLAYVAATVLAVAAVVLVVRGRKSLRTAVAPLLAAVIAYGVVVAPWMVRNAVTFGVPAISAGYGPYILSERVAHNLMDGREWLAAFAYWLPDFGDDLGPALFGEETVSRLALRIDGSGTFYEIGNTWLRQETLEAAGSPEAHLDYLIEHYVLADLPWHVAVTLPLAWRGMWVSGYWMMALLPFFLWAFVRALRTGDFAFVWMASAAWFMLGLHAFTSVNVVRYNIILIPGVAYGAALMITAGTKRLLAAAADRFDWRGEWLQRSSR